MKTEETKKSKTIKWAIVAMAVLIAALGILRFGIIIGYNKAQFAGDFGNNFESNFLGPRHGMRSMMQLPVSHGAAGGIVSIDLPEFVVADAENLEKIVTIGTSTIIRRFDDNIKSDELNVGDFVVVLGNPNQVGQIEAKLIRVMPSDPEGFTRMFF